MPEMPKGTEADAAKDEACMVALLAIGIISEPIGNAAGVEARTEVQRKEVG
jgi:hypothetical protein